MMKRFTLMMLAFIGSIAMQAQTIVLTQNTDDVITGTNSVGCPSPGAINFWARNFILIDHGITGAFTLNSGEIGIQSSGTSDATATVNIYSSTTGFPATAAGSLLGSQTVTIPSGTTESIVTYSFDTAVNIPAGTEAILVEVTGAGFFIGGTVDETTDAYLKSADCGITDYVTPSSLTPDPFTDAHFYITVSNEVLGTETNTLTQTSLYPNPVVDVLNISMPSSVELQSATMHDLLGKQSQVSISENNTINMSQMAPGVYILKLETNQGTMTQKVIKQ